MQKKDQKKNEGNLLTDKKSAAFVPQKIAGKGGSLKGQLLKYFYYNTQSEDNKANVNN